MTGLGDPGIDLGPGELTTLTGLGALGHLDLEVVGVHEELTRHSKATGRYLFDRRARVVLRVRRVETLFVLSPFTGVGLRAEAIHRDGERGVRLLGDRTVRHRAAAEALHDRRHALHLVEGKWRRTGHERQQ